MDLKHNMIVFIFIRCKLNMEYQDKCGKNKCNIAAKYAWPLFVSNSCFDTLGVTKDSIFLM